MREGEQPPTKQVDAVAPLILRDALPVQVQLAAALGNEVSRRAGHPKLRLRLHWMQWLVGVHRGMPTDLQRVLRSASRSSEYRIPPRLSVTWGVDCAARVLPVFETLLPNDHRPRLALDAVRAWLRREPTATAFTAAASAANDAIAAARTVSKAQALRPKIGTAMKGHFYDAEAVAYAAREAALAVPPSDPDCPRWMLSDQAAIRAGHAANWAAQASADRIAEFEWQRRRLVELLLGWDPNEWGDV